MGLSKKIILERLEHRGKKCIAIRFAIDDELKKRVRLIQGVIFSITHSCWYVENRKSLLGEILAAYKGIAWVDMTSLKTKIEEPGVAHIPTSHQGLVVPEPDSSKKNPDHSLASRLMEEKLKLKGYSENTVRTYLQQFKGFLQFYPDSDPHNLNELDVRNYLLYLVDRRKISRSVQNQAINAIKFFYEKVLEYERRLFMHSQEILNKNEFKKFGLIGLTILLTSIVKQSLICYQLLPLLTAGLPILYIAYFRLLTLIFFSDYPNSRPVIVYASKSGTSSFEGDDKGYEPTMKERFFSLLLFFGFLGTAGGLIFLINQLMK